jgi:hypothetical protein
MNDYKIIYFDDILKEYNLNDKLYIKIRWHSPFTDKQIQKYTKSIIIHPVKDESELDTKIEQTNREIFVSVTSIFSNQDILLETLKSISAQTLLPTKCFIYLSTDPSIFDNGFVDNIITNINLKDYILNNKIFELKWVKDIGPYTKLLPILKDKWNDDCLIITIDDDTVYDTNLIKNLVNDYNKYKCMINYRGFTFKFDKLTDITYENRTYRKLDLYNFATGKGGILYHPSFFHKTEDLIFNEELYNKYCDKTDDIWFNFIRICNKIKCYIGNKTWLAKDISSNGLYVKYNSIDNRNTKNIQGIIEFLIKSNYIK